MKFSENKKLSLSSSRGLPSFSRHVSNFTFLIHIALLVVRSVVFRSFDAPLRRSYNVSRVSSSQAKSLEGFPLIFNESCSKIVTEYFSRKKSKHDIRSQFTWAVFLARRNPETGPRIEVKLGRRRDSQCIYHPLLSSVDCDSTS